MEPEQINGPQDLINKAHELSSILFIMGKITDDVRLQFLAQMLIVSLSACETKEHIVIISHKMIEFIDEVKMKEDNISAIDKLKNKSICMN